MRYIIILLFIPIMTFCQEFSSEEKMSNEFNNIVNEFRSNNFSEVIKLADEFLKKTDDIFYSSHTLFYKGLSFLSINDIDNSLNYFNEAIKLSPKSHFYNSRATAFMAAEQWTNVLEDTTDGLKLTNKDNPDDNEIRYSLLTQAAVAKFFLDKDYCKELVMANEIKTLGPDEILSIGPCL